MYELHPIIFAPNTSNSADNDVARWNLLAELSRRESKKVSLCAYATATPRQQLEATGATLWHPVPTADPKSSDKRWMGANEGKQDAATRYDSSIGRHNDGTTWS
jgi:hypothetical protein